MSCNPNAKYVRHTPVVFAPLLTLVLATTAFGQWGYPSYHASTAAEGYQRGYADVVRAAGENNLNNAQAALVGTQAVSQHLENRMQATNTYFQMREANRQYRRQEEIAPLSTEQLYRIAAEQVPQTLASSDLDPLTGAIAWPLVLRGNEFAAGRTKLEGLFQLRATEGQSQIVFQIQEEANAMLADLKANIRNYPAPEYLKSRKFLESLAYTARAPTL